MTEARRTAPFYAPLKAFSYLALLLMGAAIAYAAVVAISNWNAIGV